MLLLAPLNVAEWKQLDEVTIREDEESSPLGRRSGSLLQPVENPAEFRGYDELHSHRAIACSYPRHETTLASASCLSMAASRLGSEERPTGSYVNKRRQGDS